MKYIVYADVMFLWIFVINYFTYYITCRITFKHISKIKLILWSVFSSLLLIIFYINTLNKNSYITYGIYIFLNIFLMIIFVKILLKIRYLGEIIRLISYNILVIILLAGIMEIFNHQEYFLRCIFSIIIILCLFIPIIHNLRSDNKRKLISNVTISLKNRCLNATGYLDTGNNLIDIHTGKPVIIISHNILMEILPLEDFELLCKYIQSNNYEYISRLNIDGEKLYPTPYRTINNEFSIIPCFKLKNITIDNIIYEDIVAGISPKGFTKGSNYDVLLNNNL